MPFCSRGQLPSTDSTMEPILWQGWLTKSPPEKKIYMKFGLIKYKWRRRFFVLYQPRAADTFPGTNAALDYYDNETRRKRIDSIDLTHCEEVLSDLDSSIYKHLFALQTKHKGRDRTYYLAADTQDEMNKWVDCLCCVLGLKENEEKPPAPQRPEPEPVAPSHERQALPRTTTIPHSASRPSPLPPKVSSQTLPSKLSDQQEPYLHLDDCYSAKPPSPGSFLSQVPPPPHSVNKLSKQPSIPDEIAPTPPTKTGVRVFDSVVGDSDGDADVYDAPRSYVNMETMDANENLLYKHPRPQQAGEIKHVMEPYDQPRPQPREPYDFPRPTQETYNIPPPRSTAETYNVPRSQRTVSRIPETPPHTQQVFPPKHDTTSIYKVPLVSMDGHGVRVDSTYDVPPRAGPTQLTREPSLRDSNSSNGSRTSNVQHGDSGFESGDPDYNRASRSVRTSDVYDVPPTHTPHHHDLFVSVPPPHYSQKGDRSPPRNEVSYMNLPSNSKAHPEYVPPDLNQCHAPSARSTIMEDDTYDIPPTTRRQSDVDMLNMTPPPPPPCTFKQHRYVNAPTGYVPKETDVYMPMQGAEGDVTYLPMQSPPTRHSSIVIENSRMSSNDDGIYGVPPSGRPVTRTVSDLVPPPLMQRASTIVREDDSYICQTNRTKSFRRNLDIRPNTEVRLPTKLTTQGDVSSSSDDDMDTMSNNSYSSHDRSLDENVDRISRSSDPKTIIPPRKGLNSTPPPPPKKGPEVLYLDLDLEKSSEPDKSPGQARTPVVVKGNRSPTDYKEIDFVRTMALSEMRKDLENKRKSSERSVDD